MRKLRLLPLLLALMLTPWLASAQPVKTEYSEAELVAERAGIAPGETLWLALRLKHREHWHSYWRNPGDSGLATEIAWEVPQGWQAGEILWPAPQRIPIPPLVNYGYEGEFLLPVAVTAPRDARPGEMVTLKAAATWLTCEKICVPEEAELSLALPVNATPAAPDARWAGLFTAARQAQPTMSPWAASVSSDKSGGGDRISLRVEAPGLDAARLQEVYFFAADGNAVQHAAAQGLRVDGKSLTLDIERGIDKGKPLAPLDGVLVLTEKLDGTTARQAFTVAAKPVAASALSQTPAVSTSSVTAIEALLMAMLGGLLLNIMPCVFPILFMKALAFARLGRAERGAVRREGLAYTAGVLATFALLAGSLLALRAGGAVIGWGFQLQSPLVVLGLAYLMALIGFNLAGLFEIRFGGNLGSGLAERGGSLGAFFTGALAVVVATPCTAPFMGAALGYAVAAPPAQAMLVFLGLGLGMALPFLLFSLAPGLARHLPRPGNWMTVFRQALAFPMFATAAWLLWVLTQQAGADAMLAGLLGMLLLGFAAWAWGKGEGLLARLPAAAAVAGALALLLLPQEQPAAATEAKLAVPSSAIAWSRFDAAAIDTARREGRPVLVNLTAAWCVTCIVNEGAALSSSTIAAKLAERRVLALKGDWTRRDPAITQYLGQYGRSGVPLYVLYPADPAASPEVLPQLLTEGIVLDALNRL
ncbi:protein-disulfide reductase DsbD family protein [Ferrovibrio sp.]|uniref:protein-disulfide reductase DsbD family protein n=1 Tax=Ferrovibrio sp. TaxID=1917215 RepID=UPI003D12D641